MSLHEKHDSIFQNPLIHSINGVLCKITNFKEKARSFYFEVILSQYQCPACSGKLRMVGQNQCSCSCGNTFDPTLVFQKSTCCGARLIKNTFHYACSQCHEIIPSRFLFDERIFDRDYFKEMMRESRRKSKEKRDEIRRLLSESRSSVFQTMDDPDLDSIPGLIQDLNEFVNEGTGDNVFLGFETISGFHLDDYRSHILSVLGWDSISFSEIEPLIDESPRLDRVWRFISLIYMDDAGEVDLTQDKMDIWVQKTHQEATS